MNAAAVVPPIGAAFLLGVIQGLTEFLPISSSGHLAATQLVFPGFAYPGVTLEVATHVGTTLAVIVYYRKLVAGMVMPQAGRDEALLGLSRDRWILLLGLGTLPTAVIGWLLQERVRAAFDHLSWVAAGLAITGVVLMASRLRKGPEQPLGPLVAVLIGVAQGLAIFPGISRSGLTITAALLARVPPRQAVTFSLLLSIPAIAGAVLLDVVQIVAERSAALLLFNHLLLATLASGFVGYTCIGLVHRATGDGWWHRFAWYCWAAAVVLILAAQQGRSPA